MEKYLQISQVKVPLDYSEEDVIAALSKKLSIGKEAISSFVILKKSIDARKSEEIHYSLLLKVLVLEKIYDKILFSKKRLQDVSKYEDSSYRLPVFRNRNLETRPVIVGSGPAGLFAAYLLALAGLKPLIIERGKSVEERDEIVNRFWETGLLDEETNVQFGEGGAGTFSDGKLNTMVKDKFGRIRFMLETFIKFGADPKILITNKPHIGTDVLKTIMTRLRAEILLYGGEYRFHTKLTGFDLSDGKIRGIFVNGDCFIPCKHLILAIGHSARDTFSLIHKSGFILEKKPFAMGLRIEHPQNLINEFQYGKASLRLPPADYKLTHKASNGRGVYSFCMCPGGYVVNASSERGYSLVNGMSYSDRGSPNANSAMVVTIQEEDFSGNDVLSGIRFQREMEKRVHQLGNGNIPVQLFGDFLSNRPSSGYGRISSVAKGKCVFSNLREILPSFMSEALIEGIGAFGKKIKGFDGEEVVLSGAETRTSAPLRIVRDSITMESNFGGIYPIGEGAGYSGGITSSAIDGIKVAEIILKKYE